MAANTNVVGDRVTIDHGVYDVKLVTSGTYKVVDEFGGHVGNFVVRGRAVEAEDFGVEGAHSIREIGRLWHAKQLAAQDAKAANVSNMVCRIATHEQPSPGDLDKARAYQTWLRSVPGVKSAFVTYDATNGRAQSITVWESKEHLAALKDRPAPEGTASPKAASVTVSPLIEAI